MSVVRIINGSYRGTQVIDQTFKLIKGFQIGKKGGFITVRNEGQFPEYSGIDTVKVKVDTLQDFEFVDGTGPVNDESTTLVSVTTTTETDEQAMERIRTRFAILDEMAAATTQGGIRAMIVSGPPGVGKSFGVEQQLEKAAMFDRISGKPLKYEIVKGAMTALGLYATLYRHSDKNHVLVFDDCDSVLMDDLALNILKAALDSGKRRRIYWNSDSSMLRREGIPDAFDFNGSCIFITNIKFDHLRSKKLQDHLEALQSRCHFLDLTIDTERDKMLRIKQVHTDTDGGLFRDYQFDGDEDQQVLEFMLDKKAKLRELSMRMALKIADLVKISPTNWKNLAENTVMKRT
jgi:hypothetical protein